MQKPIVLSKAKFDCLFQILNELGNVYAPVRVSPQSYSFKQVASEKDIAFEALRTILPPKKFFYPGQETIITYSSDGVHEHINEPEFQVVFGVHPCDLAGLGIMDTIFQSSPADNHYVRRRMKSLIVGLSCMPDKYCFCQSMGTDCPSAGFDIFLTDIGDSFFIEFRTPAAIPVATGLIAHAEPVTDDHRVRFNQFWADRDAAFTNGFKPKNVRAAMDMDENNAIWEELGERCLSCGNCTPVCPTCYCFDLVDIAALNGTDGQRRREWDSCQFSSFATVSGDFNFRPTPVDRLKFWYRHKLHGFEDAYSLPTCVGCGRCTVACPSGIDDIVAVAKALQSTKGKGTDAG